LLNSLNEDQKEFFRKQAEKKAPAKTYRGKDW